MPNFIPAQPSRWPNYWCTWGTQNYGRPDVMDAQSFLGDAGAQLARAYLDETVLLGDHGWGATLYPQIRRDLYLILDDGWDVPIRFDRRAEGDRYFGTLIPNAERFPSYRGTPPEQLRQINARVQALGWRGIGLWVAAQAVGHHGDPPESTAPYWTDRLKWSAQASIGYWKVDWGEYQHSLPFRRMLTDLAAEYAPGLQVEHAYCAGPFNDEMGTGRFDTDKYYGGMLATLEFSDVLRAYDVSPQLAVASMLDRLASLFTKGYSSAAGIINCEDEVYMGAALGCPFGIMRAAAWQEIPDLPYDPRQVRQRITEAVRAVRWTRVTPCLTVSQADTQVSTERLTDHWAFQPGETWAAWIIGKTVDQSAPAVIARGMPLPIVAAEGDKPFVVAARYSGEITAVAALPRTLNGQIRTPLADVTIEVDLQTDTLGIFGPYRSLTVHGLAATARSRRVWLQDLASDAATDVTENVRWQDGALTLPGALIHAIGTSGQAADDLSDPGVLLALRD